MPHSPLLRSAAADELIGLFERWYNLSSSPNETSAATPDQPPLAPLEFTGQDGRIWTYTRRAGWLVRAADENPPSRPERSESAAHRRVLREHEEESPWLPLLDERSPTGQRSFYNDTRSNRAEDLELIATHASVVGLGLPPDMVELAYEENNGELVNTLMALTEPVFRRRLERRLAERRVADLQSLGRISRARGWVIEESTFTEEERAALRMDTRVADALEAIEGSQLGASTYGDREATEDLMETHTNGSGGGYRTGPDGQSNSHRRGVAENVLCRMRPDDPTDIHS